MEFVHKELSDIYKKWVDTFSKERASLSDCVIGIDDALKAYFTIVDYSLENAQVVNDIQRFGTIDKPSLSSAVAMQLIDISGKPKWETDYEKCAALFYGLIQNRPFHDCNKRTALLTTLYYLSKLNRAPSSQPRELEILTLIIESNTIRDREAFAEYSKFEDGEIRFLSKYFRENTNIIDKKFYFITYGELNKKLNEFGFHLSNPHGNSIDLVRIENRSSIFGLLKNRTRFKKIATISFKGWTREVAEEEMEILYDYSGIDEKNGLSRCVVYEGDPPFLSLINKYDDIMERLAKK